MSWKKTVVDVMGYALHLAQNGFRFDKAKVLKGFGSAGVLEVVEDNDGNTYRAVYTVRFRNAVYVLHCFQKKSHKGIATPKHEMDIVEARLKLARCRDRRQAGFPLQIRRPGFGRLRLIHSAPDRHRQARGSVRVSHSSTPGLPAPASKSPYHQRRLSRIKFESGRSDSETQAATSTDTRPAA